MGCCERAKLQPQLRVCTSQYQKVIFWVEVAFGLSFHPDDPFEDFLILKPVRRFIRRSKPVYGTNLLNRHSLFVKKKTQIYT